MNTRSLLTVLCLIALGLCATIQVTNAAEPTSSQREAAQLKIDEVRTRLALTPEQEAKMAPLIQARNQKLQTLRDSMGSDASRRQRRGALKEAREIQKEFVEQVEPLLTKEQQKEWEVIRKEMRDAMIERYRNR